MDKKLILLVDDEPAFREIFGIKLQGAGFEVVTAENGADALKKLETVKPDLMLLDMEMPVMNGAETLVKMRSDPKLKAAITFKIAFLTNLGESQKEALRLDEKFAKEFGADDYIKKTDDLPRIVEKVKSLCGIAPSSSL